MFRSVEVAASYNEGMLFAKEHFPDLLLIDSKIFIDNPGLIKEIEKLKHSNPALKVLFLFLFREEDINRCQELFPLVSGIILKESFAERYGDGRVVATSRDVYQSLNILQDARAQQAASADEDEEQAAVDVDQVWRERVAILNDFLPVAQEEYGFAQIFVTDPQGEIVGTVNIIVDQGLIDDLVHEGVENLAESADSYLIDASGMLLSNTMLGEYREGAAMNVTISTEGVEMFSAPIREGDTEFEYQEEFPDYNGDMVLSAGEVVMSGNVPAGMIVEVYSAEAFAGIDALRNIMLIIGVVAATIVAFVGFYIAVSIANPVRQVATIAGKIAGGDFTVETQIKRKDEIGQLGQAFNAMGESLRGLISTAVEMSNGVNSGSEQVSSASEEMSSSLEEVSASTNEFASNAENLSTNSQTMVETNSKILERAEEGNQAIEDAINQMQVISNRVSELQDVINEVDQRSNDIGKILGVITDIADQTNLLALNAAIEAARAGKELPAGQ